ncbi:putative mannan endo-1,4-beta-mannosidase 9 [Iris pallida]|uniref:mannan endo-1,4-beta-mannosidase n=1 Tax=Iris pallida TaxID=29817 RepID=A0AAX6DRG9_IRIPA|nr:putative mannan endo-1,4-beta-mannosidase 9 [Iris pallida]
MAKLQRAFCSFSLVLLLLLQHGTAGGSANFVRTRGTHFELNGRPFYSNGFNAYWLMYMGSDPSTRDKVTAAFQQAAAHGLTVVRTWGFSDGGYKPLQISPGYYNEDMFKGLDFVVSEASKYGVHLILSFVNYYNDFGGRKQYIQWSRDQGQWLNDEDDFYRSNLVKGWYKNHIKAVLTRTNTFTGVAYKDDPAIFAWELINEPRCQSDMSGLTLQNWISEMAGYVKSIDSNHMLEIGLEGFYGETMPDRKQFNPGYQIGTDFISNNQIPQIDFATIHMYPDQWIQGSDDNAQLAFIQSWITSHANDAGGVIGKPLLVAEFGKNTKTAAAWQRDNLYWAVYNSVYNSAKAGGAAAGALFWQLMVDGMDNWRDGYEVVFSQSPSTADVIDQQSLRIFGLNYATAADHTKVAVATAAARKLGKPSN